MPKPVELEVVDAVLARAPNHSMTDEDVEATEFEYSTRAPEDWVASGPMGEFPSGTGRYFDNIDAATRWAKKFYGERLKGVITESTREGAPRWAFLIRGPRGAK